MSPRASASNLHETRLSSLAENPESNETALPRPKTEPDKPSDATANGVDAEAPVLPKPEVNGAADLSDVVPPPGPPPGQKDEEGFTVRDTMNDPITEAQREAAGDDADQPFKLAIQNRPVAEEDPEAKQAALSNVANSLKMGPATKRSGTIRGRRDVRNTIYQPAPSIGDATGGSSFGSAAAGNSFASSTGPAAIPAAFTSETSVAGVSDNQSVRSGASLGSSFAHMKHPDMTGPGLNSSIVESVSANFDDGVIKSATIAGEIAFVHNGAEPGDSKSMFISLLTHITNHANTHTAHETIKINNFPRLEKIGPNRIFVQNASPDQPDQFSLDLSHINKTSTAFSYRVFSDSSDPPSLAGYAPLQLKPAWKPQGDKLGLLLQYNLNPTCSLTGPVTLHNVVFVATYSGRASGAQTKPSGTHVKDKHLVYWRLGDVTLTADTQKIVCRILGADGVEPTPGHVEARWEYAAPAETGAALASGISVSRLDDKGKGKAKSEDPFGDEADKQMWLDVPLVTKLVSGKYEGN